MQKWSTSPKARKKRVETISSGVYVVEHVATGKLLIGTSESVSATVDRNLKRLEESKHTSKAFNQLMKLDSDLLVYEIACPKSRLKRLEKSIRTSVEPKYLLVE